MFRCLGLHCNPEVGPDTGPERSAQALVRAASDPDGGRRPSPVERSPARSPRKRVRQGERGAGSHALCACARPRHVFSQAARLGRGRVGAQRVQPTPADTALGAAVRALRQLRRRAGESRGPRRRPCRRLSVPDSMLQVSPS
ncbi:hypothetical protein NDU88_004448 [Pleurodeles waltl]|uniref:Uncharacterized protein n=1 Tax=Pleurodeles waltl TaxID=8319 RepID=A0AAV7PL06_PLEWA|nr:hypothetical protein NDU88_004448 [Pleurodeles waltl]